MPTITEEAMQMQDDSVLTLALEQPAEYTYIFHQAYPNERKKPIYLILKRTADILLSLLGLVLLSPLFLLVAIAVKLESKGPAIYIHKRVGQNETELNLYKFRTMKQNADELLSLFTPEQKIEYEENYKLYNDPRLTRIGKFLRESSLDELPQLFNILQGNLSFVGPRPVVEKELEKYGMLKACFLSVKPGLTGNWQINRSSAATYRERVKLELFYANNASIWLDIKIFFLTIPVLIKKFI